MRRFVTGLGIIVLVMGFAVTAAGAEPGFFSSDCASCHSDDTPSCIGCHHHKGTLNATADQTSYHPGDPVTVTLTGGTRPGWMRGLLYDENHVELDRKTGPTGTGDDSGGNPVIFPVTLHAPAPAVGDHVWRAGWFGNNNGSGHLEVLTNVTIHVVEPPADAPADDSPTVRRTWGRVRAWFR